MATEGIFIVWTNFLISTRLKVLYRGGIGQ